MTNQDAATWPDLLVIKEFLDPLLCRRIVAEMNAAQAEAATVYSHTVSDYVDQNMRQTLRIRPSTETIELITNRLRAHQQTIEKHFAVSLSECEDPQFLRYRVGDFFVAHQDGNTGLLRLDSERRRISLVIFLSRESELPEADAYCGGSLILSDLRSDRKVHLIGAPGKLVVFRAETTHEVTPVTHGERYSIVSWFR
jgi:SM-20-related protein